MKTFLKRIVCGLCALILAVIAVTVCTWLFLIWVYPRVDYTFPDTAIDSDYDIVTVGDTYILVEYGLPYPTVFEDTNRPTQDLSGTWKMRFDPDEMGLEEEWFLIQESDDSWQDYQVPSTYNAFESPHRHHTGVTWYMLTFTADGPSAPNPITRLCFRGVLLTSDVWLNGTHLGSREGGYTPFYFNVTDIIRPGETNVLIVRADNRIRFDTLPTKQYKYHTQGGWGEYGGIYRDVYLEKLPGQYLCKAVVRAVPGETGGVMDMNLAVHRLLGSTEFVIEGIVFGPDGMTYPIDIGTPISEGEYRLYPATASIPAPRLWSTDDPATYTVKLHLQDRMSDDRVTVVTGFRTIEITDDALLINGEETILLGISKHEDDPNLGATQNELVIKRDLDLIEDMGANFIRMSHYPHDIREIRACRDRGIMVSEEIPHYQVGLGWTTWFHTGREILKFPASTFGMKQLHFDPLLISTRRQLIEMVERNINNPAVILWFISNESYTLYKSSGRFYGHLRDVIRAFDDSRPVTKAEVTYDIPFFDNHRKAPDHLDIGSLNSYYGWYYGTAEDAGPKIDIYHEQHPEKLLILSEFGASAAPGRTDEDGVYVADRVSPGKTYSEEYQEYVIRTYMNSVREREYIVGVSPWIFADFYCPWFPGNVVPYYNMKGVVSRDRVPKLSYYTLKETYTDISENGR